MIPGSRPGLFIALAALVAVPAEAAAQEGQVSPPAQQQGAGEEPKRLGRPFPGPVQPPPPLEEPEVHVSVVSPQESRVTRRRMRSGDQRQGLRDRGGAARDTGAGDGLDDRTTAPDVGPAAE